MPIFYILFINVIHIHFFNNMLKINLDAFLFNLFFIYVTQKNLHKVFIINFFIFKHLFLDKKNPICLNILLKEHHIFTFLTFQNLFDCFIHMVYLPSL